jgi:pantothenate kinase
MANDSQPVLVSSFDALIAELRSAVGRILSEESRCVVAVAGPPAAGKSTLAEQLLGQFTDVDGGSNAALVPMDGYHLDNAQLILDESLDRKGAPHTFDIGGLGSMLGRLRTAESPIYVPKFDRASDLSRNSAIKVVAEHNLIIVEGNYLLLNRRGWRNLSSCFDLTILIDVPEAVLKQRLVQRWLKYGLTDADAIKRAEFNDIPNAFTVSRESVQPDILYRPNV